MEYIESHFKKATSLEGMGESDIMNLLGGNGGSQVDLVLYVIHQSRSAYSLYGAVLTGQKSNLLTLSSCGDSPH
jgi:hypothetical protein